MNDDDVALLENMDEEHWYGKNRNSLLHKLVLKHVDLTQNILEIGCGTGTILSSLQLNGYKVTGLEPTLSGFKACSEKHLNVYNLYVEQYLPKHKFDAVLLFDVLEHIEDHSGVIQHIYENLLAKNGVLIIAVPSSPALWSQVDEDVFHFRRYTFRLMKELLNKSNFEITYWRRWVTLMYPLVFFHRKFFNSGFKNENQKPNFLVNFILTLILKCEYHINLKFLPSVSMMFVAKQKRN